MTAIGYLAADPIFLIERQHYTKPPATSTHADAGSRHFRKLSTSAMIVSAKTAFRPSKQNSGQ